MRKEYIRSTWSEEFVDIIVDAHCLSAKMHVLATISPALKSQFPLSGEEDGFYWDC